MTPPAPTALTAILRRSATATQSKATPLKSQKNLPQTTTESHAVSRNISFSVLSDENLDRKIAQLNQSVDAALADHKTAERSAVEDAWALGQHLVEKKNRLKHGEFLPWLATTGIADSTANEFMMLARQITSVGDLGVSIRSSIRGLKPPPQPAASPTRQDARRCRRSCRA